MAAYGTDDGLASWLADQGYALPSGTPSPAVLRARGSAYVDSYEARWTGVRTDGVMQESAWPRTGAMLGCTTSVPDDAVPPAIVAATYRAAWLEASTPGILAGTPTAPGRRVRRQKVEGAVEREFFDDGKASVGGGPTLIDPAIDALLSAFICEVTGGAFVWSVGG